MTRVLVIDDEPHILRALRINLSVRGYEVVTASTGAGALQHDRRAHLGPHVEVDRRRRRVGAEPDPHARVEEIRQRRDAASEQGVRAGAVRDADALVVYRLDDRTVEVHAAVAPLLPAAEEMVAELDASGA